MQPKGYFIFRGNVYDSNEVMDVLLQNPRIRVSINNRDDLIIDGNIIRKISEPIENIISNLLCFKSLAYCCSLEKPCSNRDLAFELLGISKDQYIELKDELDKKIFSLVKNEIKSIRENSAWNEEKVPIESLDNADLSDFFEPSSPFKNRVIKNADGSQNELSGFFEDYNDERKQNMEIDSCIRCGCKIGRYTRFCPNCGEPIHQR